jgi:hypothetical protein
MGHLTVHMPQTLKVDFLDAIIRSPMVLFPEPIAGNFMPKYRTDEVMSMRI